MIEKISLDGDMSVVSTKQKVNEIVDEVNRLSEVTEKNKFGELVHNFKKKYDEEVKKGKWMPKEREHYYWINHAGDVCLGYYTDGFLPEVKEKQRYTGVFKTEEAAEARRDAIKQFCESL